MGKELIFQTLRHEQTNEIPWVPFAGVHVGKLKGYTAEEVLRDEDKLVECLLEADKLYRPDGMPIIFDLQVEAEILGCDLMWAENNRRRSRAIRWPERNPFLASARSLRRNPADCR